MIALPRITASVLLAVLFALATANIAAAACPATSLPAIEKDVMCPICGVPLINAGGPQADNEREFIRELVDQCKTKDQIMAALVAEYGDEVRAIPDYKGFDLIAYVGPAIGIGIGAIALAFGALRWRRTREDSLDSGLAGRADASSDAIDKDLQRYDL